MLEIGVKGESIDKVTKEGVYYIFKKNNRSVCLRTILSNNCA